MALKVQVAASMALKVQVALDAGSWRAKNSAGKRSLDADLTKVINVTVEWSDQGLDPRSDPLTEHFPMLFHDHGQNRDVYLGYSVHVDTAVVLKIQNAQFDSDRKEKTLVDQRTGLSLRSAKSSN